jgi:Holliday junction resolvasome RuvABC endonuclease subunit
VRRVALGTDPGSSALGLGVIGREGQSVDLLAFETVRPKADDLTECEREIYQRTTALIRAHHPLVMGIEDQRGVSTAARLQQKRALEAARKGHTIPEAYGYSADNDGVIEVVGVLKAAAFAYGVPIVLIRPQTMKIGILGNGHGDAEKDEVKAGLSRFVRGLIDVKRISLNATDALGIAVCAERITFLETLRAG